MGDDERIAAGGWCAPHERTFEDGEPPVRLRPAGTKESGPLWSACTVRIALGGPTEWSEIGVDGEDPESVGLWVERALEDALPHGVTLTVTARVDPVPEVSGSAVIKARWMRADPPLPTTEDYRVVLRDDADADSPTGGWQRVGSTEPTLERAVAQMATRRRHHPEWCEMRVWRRQDVWSVAATEDRDRGTPMGDMSPRYPEDYEVMGGTDRYRVEVDGSSPVLVCREHGPVSAWDRPPILEYLVKDAESHDRERHADG